ncbi:hypothetical protein B0T25DRAFT_174460 [Lasiosphaeria hispida]|uniref:Uncharacterized protein n=1 Tax=Lasiosphaeria hispida TaxID=260671 RepID=A0AAJ0MGQ1_9PEZI|nr:hypothetical protein B0T25DRAFT_174460 [Lasiosphaeria hispida]
MGFNMSPLIMISIALVLSLLSRHTAASLLIEQATDQCSFHTTPGTATCCCNGDCGTESFSQKDFIWGSGCREYETPSVCSSTQVYSSTNDSATFDNGGRCYSTCNWEKWQYHYKCCDCPPGYRTSTSELPNCGFVNSCIACSEPWETPVSLGNSTILWECRRKGLDCSAVDAIAGSFDAATKGPEGTTATRYYGQLLDQACLRSNCTAIAACQRVSGFESDNPECRSLDGDVDFEQTVLEETAKLKPSDGASVATAAKEADSAGTALGNAFGASSIALGSENPLLSLFIVASGGTDPSAWGKTYAGISHFSSSLAPQVQGYIRNLVKSNLDNQQLQSKLLTLADEQDRMFRCAVIPNLQVQASKNEILPNPSLAGGLLAPLGATTHRMAATKIELDRAKRFESFKKSLSTIGITLPRDDKLIWNPRNWADTPTLPGLSTNLTELSPSAGDANPLMSLAIPSKLTLTIQPLDRDHATSEPLMARTALLDPASNPSLPAPLSWKISGHNLQLISPIGAIYPALGDLAMWNSTHVIPSNISAQPVLFGEYLTKGQGQPAPTVDRYILYRRATVKLHLAQDVLDKYPAGNLAMYDLVSGVKLDAQFKAVPEGGGEWSADVSAGKGSYEGQWGGGGCFGVGLTTEGKSAGVRGRMAMGNVLAGVGLVVLILGGWL